MNKKIITMLALLLVSVLRAFCQPMPLLNVPSPEVAGLGEYGMVPVGLYTGVPDISVPLHEMKVGGNSFSVTASYHLASVKPGMQEGCLGLGWSLQSGGYISRSVNGIYDEQMHADGYTPGYYANAYRLKGMTNEQFNEATKSIRSEVGAHTSYYELSADEFSFSFFGYSGTFFYNENGGWTVVSDQDIRVEFNPAEGDGFIHFKSLLSRFNPGFWSNQGYNDRFFNRFTLVTPDGCRYEFGGIKATEYSISYYNRSYSDLVATTWRLSKIVTPDNRVVTYDYEATDLLCDLRYVPQSKVVYDLYCDPSLPSSGRNAMTGFLVMPVRLASIETPDERISFDYFTDPVYGERFWSMALGWNEDEYYPVDIFNIIHDFDMKQFSVFMKTPLDYTSSPILQQSVRNNLKHSVLHRIGIRNKHDVKRARSVYFDYTFNNRRKVSLIASREGIPPLVPDYASAPGMLLLRGYKVPVSLTPDKDPEYAFAYNADSPMPDSYTNAETDYWGYYAGRNVSFAAIPEFKKPDPSLKYAQSDVLTEITYPTGGKSRFEYELNSYSRVVDVSHTRLNSQSGKAGGLRVSAVSRHDAAGVLLDRKKYYYAESRNAASSGILSSAPVYSISYTSADKKTLKLESQAGYCASVTNLNSPVVGYSCVIEETLDASGNSQGYIKRRYSNYDADPYGQTHFDAPATYSNLIGESAVKPFSSRSMERGRLLSEESYGASGRLLKKSAWHYTAVNPGSSRSAHQETLFFCVAMVGGYHYCAGTLTDVYTHVCLPDSVIEMEYPSEGSGPGFSTRRTLSYDAHKLLKTETELTSKGFARTVNYTYPADRTNYRWMVDAHLLSPVVEKTTTEGNKSLKETRSYGYCSADSKYIPYITGVSHLFDGADIRTDYQVQKADAYANPVSVVAKGVNSVLIWGYEGQRLIARIENAAYDRVRALLGKAPESFSVADRADDIGYGLIEGIRHKLPKARVAIYKYTSGLKMESVTSPDGQTVFYKYDYLDRLREEYFLEKISGVYQKNILNAYDYHYRHLETTIHPVH